jgi:DNA repair protein RecO (recombination protein O)
MDEAYRVIKGIVVREAKFRESNRMLTILTEDGGRVEALARAADRKNSRLAAGCSLLCYSEFTLFTYKGRVTVDEAEAVDSFPELKEDLAKLALATYFCDVAARLAEVDFADDEAFRLTMNAVYAVARLALPLALVKAVFEIRAAVLAGFAPATGFCALCGKEPSAALLEKRGGVVYCLACGLKEEAEKLPAGSALFYLPPGALKAFNHVMSADLKKIFGFSASKKDVFALAETAESYLSAQLGMSPKTLAFYHKIADNGASYI